MSLLPSRGPDASTSQEGELEIVGVDEDVSAVLDALSSDTAREILNTVYDEPGTPSELADRLGMSIQKVSYHLEKLEEEELITVAGTRYSEKGQEMKVYEPPDDPLVLFVGTRERKRSLRSLVKRLVPVVGLLTAVSFVIELLLGNFPLPIGTTGSGGEDAAPQAGGDGDGQSAADGGEQIATTDQSKDSADLGGNVTVNQEEPSPAATADPQTTAGGDGGGGISIAEATETATPEATGTPAGYQLDAATEVAQTAASGGGPGLSLSPGLAFFLGGLLVLLVVTAAWAYGESV
ncbi:helix-turn-helix domain-containing protein [Haloarcula pelagica]|uniref:helix-turn-helix domain-containing protein n=1 Tax=Haloarcula pelagica TaxID=3033389 RepID=UPI0024C2D067|nr:helix-turn-helix domain-containing protein [Halomicroarcula sp. YJ-61-S]